MDNDNNLGNHHIPPQVFGEHMDVVEQRSFNDPISATNFFSLVKQRLLDVNSWAEFAGTASATFQLADALGREVKRSVQKGDYFRIDIPGPGTTTGKGYDWVLVEDIIEEQTATTELLVLRVRPADNPLTDNGDTAHFLTEQATSTFTVKRIGRDIFAEEHGRNEQANTYTDSTVDNIRNMMVGWAAMLRFSYPQWKSLMSGLLADPE